MKAKCLVYVTAPDYETAIKIGHGCVKAGLAACANVIPEMTSIYTWQDEIRQDQESILILKTTEETVPDLTHFINIRHPFDNPCVIAMPVVGGNQKFLDWIDSSVKERRS